MRKMAVTIIIQSKTGFLSLSAEESIPFKVFLRTIDCPVYNVNVCLTDD